MAFARAETALCLLSSWAHPVMWAVTLAYELGQRQIVMSQHLC